MKQNLPIFYCDITLSIQNSNRSPVMTKTFKSTLTYHKDGKQPISNPLHSAAIKPYLPTTKKPIIFVESIEKLFQMGTTNY